MRGRMTVFLVLAAALLHPAMAVSLAQTLDGRDRDMLIQQRRWNDLDELNRIESRQRFQNRQQQLLELDRQAIRGQLEQGPGVEPVRPGACTQDLFGSRSFRNCR